MRSPANQFLPLITAAAVLLAQGISVQGAFAVAKWGEPTQKAPRVECTTVSSDSTGRVWEELSRMSSGFKGRNLIAGSQTEGDAASSVADGKIVADAVSSVADGETVADASETSDVVNDESSKAEESSKTGDGNGLRTGGDGSSKVPENSAKSTDQEKSSDAAAGSEVISSLRGLTPTESYLKCREAMLKAKSISEVIPYLSRASGAEASADLVKSPDDAKGKLELLQLMMPPQVKVTSEKISGNTAVLTAIPLAPSSMDEGMSQLMNGMAQGLANAMGSKEKLPPTKTETSGSIYMTLEDGVWKQDKEKWSSQIKEASGR